MSLFPPPPAPVEPPSTAALIIPVAIGAAICLADTLIGRLAGGSERMPVGLICGGSIALGGVVGWVWGRLLARRAS